MPRKKFYSHVFLLKKINKKKKKKEAATLESYPYKLHYAAYL